MGDREAVKVLKFLLALVLCGAAATSRANSDPGYSYYEIGNVKAARPAATQEALLLVGGGDWNLKAFRWFAAKTGHGHLVVIAAYGDGEDGKYLYRDVGGFASVQTLVFNNRKASYDPRVLRVLRHADGIFIAGGDQSKYVRFWKGTPVAQCVPVKRETWVAQTSPFTAEETQRVHELTKAISREPGLYRRKFRA